MVRPLLAFLVCLLFMAVQGFRLAPLDVLQQEVIRWHSLVTKKSQLYSDGATVPLWTGKDYIVWPILFFMYIMLVIVTSFVTIALTYSQLAVEDHQWWWRSFLCDGSTSLYVYGYCFYYYFHWSEMSSLLQASFFFGYMLMMCFGLFLVLGTIGWRSSLTFVRLLYRSNKGA